MRRLLRLVVALVGIAVALVAVAAGLLVWRVQQGPLPLDFLVPQLERALTQDGTWTVDVDGLELVWRTAERHLELRARGLRIARRGESAFLELAAARIRLRRRALLHGEIVVTAVELDGPRLELARDADGHLSVEIGSPSARGEGVEWISSALARLEHIAVRNGQVTFVDEPSHTTWQVPQVDADVWRSGGPLRVQMGLSLGAGEAAMPVWFDGLYNGDAGTLTLEVSSPGTVTSAAFAAWPSTLVPEAHAWVTTRLARGRIRDALLTVEGHVVHEDEWELAIDAFAARVGFEGMSVRFLDTMPPAVDVKGTARFTREDVAITVDAGKLEGLAVVPPSTVRVAWPPKAPNRLAVDVNARGPLASLLAVLQRPPVALGERVSISTAGAGGTASTRVQMAFPLGGKLALGKLGLRASSKLTNASIPRVAGDWDLTEGDLVVTVDDQAAGIEGKARVRGVPVAIRFGQHFTRAGSTRLVLTSRLDAAQRQALGVDTGTWLTGPVDAEVRLTPAPAGRMAAEADVDLSRAVVSVPALAMQKASGERGRALARVAIAGGTVSAVEHFEVGAGGVTIRGSAGRASKGATWDRVDATAAFSVPDVPAGGAGMQLALRATPSARTGWQTTVTSRDVGFLLRAYGVDRARGGTLLLEGTSQLEAAGVPFEGRLTVEKVTLTRVPWTVKLLSMASIRGLLDLGSEQVIQIDRGVATVVHRPPGTIEVRDAIARGPKLGFTLSGRLDYRADTIDVEGTLISTSVIGEGAARIPVLGTLLKHATGGAVQAVTFTARGSRTDPTVAVGPLSSIAPGVLRDWIRKLGL